MLPAWRGVPGLEVCGGQQWRQAKQAHSSLAAPQLASAGTATAECVAAPHVRPGAPSCELGRHLPILGRGRRVAAGTSVLQVTSPIYVPYQAAVAVVSWGSTTGSRSKQSGRVSLQRAIWGRIASRSLQASPTGVAMRPSMHAHCGVDSTVSGISCKPLPPAHGRRGLGTPIGFGCGPSKGAPCSTPAGPIRGLTWSAPMCSNLT
jgi:hypothetical protein